MKKLGILVMAMVLVCGMSLGVMAAEGSLEGDDDTVSDDIGVNLTVEKYAEVIISDGPLNLTAEGPQNTDSAGPAVAKDTTGITIKANTGIDVEVKENLSRDIADTLGDDSLVEATNNEITMGGASSQDYLDGNVAVGLGAWLRDEGSNSTQTGTIGEWNDGALCNYSFDTDDISKDGVTLEDTNGVYYDGLLHMNMVWYGDAWHEIEAHGYDGTVEVIVSAN